MTQNDPLDRRSQLTRELGRTGIQVFPVGLGGMQLSMGKPPPEDAAIDVIYSALDAGVNFIDTANVYCGNDHDIGHNERLIEKALRLRRATNYTIVATKGGVDRKQRKVDASPAFLRSSCIESLRALNRDEIILYQLHSPDDNVPIEDSIGEMSRLKQEGKVIHLGLCNVTIAELRCAQNTERIECVQNRCNPINAEDYTNGLVEECERSGVSYVPHSVVGGRSSCLSIVEQPIFVDLSDKYRASPFEIIIAWHLAKSRSVIPIPGASRSMSAKSSAAAAQLKLSTDDIRAIDENFSKP